MLAEINHDPRHKGYFWKVPLDNGMCYRGFSKTFRGAEKAAKKAWKAHSKKRQTYFIELDK